MGHELLHPHQRGSNVIGRETATDVPINDVEDSLRSNGLLPDIGVVNITLDG